MKAIMYHYVHPKCPDIPYFKHLDFDDFKRQLDLFEKKYGFIPQEEFIDCVKSKKTPPNGVILTFDDGLRCHYDYVYKELIQRNLWGFFFISISPFQTKKLLNVHRIHLLLGIYGGLSIYTKVNNYLNKSTLQYINNKDFHEKTYIRQENDIYTKKVKQLLNYYVSTSGQQDILDKLANKYLSEDVSKYYLSIEKIQEMHRSNMIIGSHGVSHSLMSKLSKNKQKKELKNSYDFLNNILDKQWIKTYCHPYGNSFSYNHITKDLLKKTGYQFAFAVNPRDFTKEDFYESSIYTLPRYDCNQFDFGKAVSFF